MTTLETVDHRNAGRYDAGVRTAHGGMRGLAVALLLLVGALVAGACGDSDDDEEAATPTTAARASQPAPATGASGNRFACLDFEATVTSGPNAGKSWTGDLVLNPDETGAFTGVLVPVGVADRNTLEVKDRSKAICRAVGQRNGAQVSWFLYCPNNEVVFGIGQITPVGNVQELRGILSGPTPTDFGVYHGRNYPPYIRIISAD